MMLWRSVLNRGSSRDSHNNAHSTPRGASTDTFMAVEGSAKMTITVRRARHGSPRNRGGARNWLVIDDARVTHVDGQWGAPGGVTIWSERSIRTYVCTEWPNAMRLADDLANGRDVDPWLFIAMSERRA